MSLLSKLRGEKEEDIDSLKNDIIENISGVLSSRAPILLNLAQYNEEVQNSIMSLGLKNTTRFQKKYNGKFLFEEIMDLLHKYEPRLTEVEIEPIESSGNANLFEFRIKGVIQYDDIEDAMLLDSCIDFGTNLFKVRKINFV